MLQAEEALDLVPERHEQHDRDRDEQEHDRDEVEPCPRLLAPALDAHPSTCPVKAVRPFHGLRIDRRLVGNGRDPPGWLRHPRDSKRRVGRGPAA